LSGAARGGASVFRPDGWRVMARDATRAGDVALDRLRKRAEFLRTRGGRSWAAPSLVLQARRRRNDETGAARFGFTATKRLGSAVKRNRARRRLKEAVRLVAPSHARAGYDYVVIARQGTLTHAFPDIVKELQTALRRVHPNPSSRRARR
jgi:ribonuclease P protein component